VLAYTVALYLLFLFTLWMLMKSALFAAVPLRCLLTDCGPPYLLLYCLLLLHCCEGLFFAMESRVEKVFDDNWSTLAGKPSIYSVVYEF